VNTTPPTASISGTAYFDTNCNGVPDPGEYGISDVLVYIDLTHSGSYQPGDPSVLTGLDGSYTFTNLPAGTYTIAVQPTPGHVGTSPPLSVTLSGSDMIGQNLGVLHFSPVGPVPVTPNLGPQPLKSADYDYVYSLYQTVLGRTPSMSEVTGWVDQIASGWTYQQVAEGFINSTEHRWDQVDYYYSVLLNRAPDPLAVTWFNMLQAGVSEQTVVEGIIASPEFQSEHVSDASYISALYEDVLGRPGSDAEIASWEAKLAGGETRSQAAATFVGGLESCTLLVGDYASYLHRGLDPMAVDLINELVANTMTIDEVAVGILTSDEYIKEVT
jgi:hypothetical protein